MRESMVRTGVWALPIMPMQGAFACGLGVAFLSLMFLSVAVWNGFPLIFFDTGAYVLEGLGHVFLVERAPVYSELLFLAGGAFSMWPIVILQAAMTSYLILEVARAEVPGLTLWGLTVMGGALSLLTGVGWYAGQVEPDIFTPMVILGSYLLLFRGDRLGKVRLAGVTGLTGLAVACHPSHLGLLGGILVVAAVLKLALWRRLRIFRPHRPSHLSGATATSPASAACAGEVLPASNLRRGFTGLVTALCLIVVGNFVMTGNLFISKSGSVFLFARLMQDGIVKRLMNDTCPPAGDIDWRLCEYKNRLSTSANGWLWGAGSGFHALGGFSGKAQQDEYSRIITESLKRYPVMHLRAAVNDSFLQFLQFKTGDGIEPQLSILESGFKRMIPGQVPAYLGARQQRGLIRFKTLNLIHVPVGALSVLGLLLLLQHAAVRRTWGEGTLPALVLLGLIGNAIICGTFSNPHDRYQSRVIWLPSLVLLLAVARDRRALQPVPESGT
jgi:hypothetical protein